MLDSTEKALIKIRAHHLLCLQGFQGYGYDKNFTQGMKEILKVLKSNPSPNIQLVTEADEICGICPNLVDGVCVDCIKIKTMDLNVIETISLENNQIVTFKKALQIIDKELSLESIKKICEGCVWMDKCLFFLNKIGSIVESQ